MVTTLHQIEADVFHALPRLPSCWAHGCVTDPPYGWSFMGRDFDRQHRSGAFDALMDEQARFAGWLTAAERRERHVRRFTEAERYVLWSLAWLREVYRVLVPGAILAAFQGSKSYDLTAFAARLAGFEVLPMVCGITGQAMAQGGDVGKLIDRERAGGHATVLDGTRWIRERMESRGLRPADLNAATKTQMAGHWTSRQSQPAIPTAEQWELLEPLLGPPPPWLDAMILPAFEPGGAWHQREKVGAAYASRIGKAANLAPEGSGWYDITAPATPLAHDFDGHGTRIRDQLFPVLVAMKPTEGSFAANASRWGVAGFDVDGCRVKATPEDVERIAKTWTNTTCRTKGHCTGEPGGSTRPDISRGRYPGNVVLDAAAAEEVGEMSGYQADGVAVRRNRSGSPGAWATYSGPLGACEDLGHGGSGTAARYFRRFRYLARAPKFERRRGLETWHWKGDPLHPEGWRRVTVAEWQAIPKRRQMVGSNHPTLKALEFATWVSRLILPPIGPEARAIRERTTGSPGRLLVPFSGVGSEAIGAALAGWPEIVAVELSPSYVEQAACRWSAWGPYSSERAAEIERTGDVATVHAQGTLFEP